MAEVRKKKKKSPPPHQRKNVESKATFEVGLLVDAMDKNGLWCEATITQVRSGAVKVHFKGWGAKFDEWIGLDEDRIVPLYPDSSKTLEESDGKINSADQIPSHELSFLEPKNNVELSVKSKVRRKPGVSSLTLPCSDKPETPAISLELELGLCRLCKTANSEDYMIGPFPSQDPDPVFAHHRCAELVLGRTLFSTSHLPAIDKFLQRLSKKNCSYCLLPGAFISCRVEAKSYELCSQLCHFTCLKSARWEVSPSLPLAFCPMHSSSPPHLLNNTLSICSNESSSPDLSPNTSVDGMPFPPGSVLGDAGLMSPSLNGSSTADRSLKSYLSDVRIESPLHTVMDRHVDFAGDSILSHLCSECGQPLSDLAPSCLNCSSNSIEPHLADQFSDHHALPSIERGLESEKKPQLVSLEPPLPEVDSSLDILVIDTLPLPASQRLPCSESFDSSRKIDTIVSRGNHNDQNKKGFIVRLCRVCGVRRRIFDPLSIRQCSMCQGFVHVDCDLEIPQTPTSPSYCCIVCRKSALRVIDCVSPVLDSELPQSTLLISASHAEQSPDRVQDASVELLESIDGTDGDLKRKRESSAAHSSEIEPVILYPLFSLLEPVSLPLCFSPSSAVVFYTQPFVASLMLCKLCGSAGYSSFVDGDSSSSLDEYGLIQCRVCAEVFHPYCLPCFRGQDLSQAMACSTAFLIKSRFLAWTCEECSLCKKCQKPCRRSAAFLACSKCDCKYHTSCVISSHEKFADPWTCPDCLVCFRCDGALLKEGESSEHKEAPESSLSQSAHSPSKKRKICESKKVAGVVSCFAEGQYRHCSNCVQFLHQEPPACLVCKLMVAWDSSPDPSVPILDVDAEVSYSHSNAARLEPYLVCLACKAFVHMKCENVDPMFASLLNARDSPLLYLCAPCRSLPVHEAKISNRIVFKTSPSPPSLFLRLNDVHHVESSGNGGPIKMPERLGVKASSKQKLQPLPSPRENEIPKKPKNPKPKSDSLPSSSSKKVFAPTTVQPSSSQPEFAGGASHVLETKPILVSTETPFETRHDSSRAEFPSALGSLGRPSTPYQPLPSIDLLDSPVPSQSYAPSQQSSLPTTNISFEQMNGIPLLPPASKFAPTWPLVSLQSVSSLPTNPQAAPSAPFVNDSQKMEVFLKFKEMVRSLPRDTVSMWAMSQMFGAQCFPSLPFSNAENRLTPSEVPQIPLCAQSQAQYEFQMQLAEHNDVDSYKASSTPYRHSLNQQSLSLQQQQYLLQQQMQQMQQNKQRQQREMVLSQAQRLRAQQNSIMWHQQVLQMQILQFQPPALQNSLEETREKQQMLMFLGHQYQGLTQQHAFLQGQIKNLDALAASLIELPPSLLATPHAADSSQHEHRTPARHQSIPGPKPLLLSSSYSGNVPIHCESKLQDAPAKIFHPAHNEAVPPPGPIHPLEFGSMPHKLNTTLLAVHDCSASMIANLEPCALLPLSSAPDPRACILCRKTGDLSAARGGRLLYVAVDTWAHVQCVYWSKNVHEVEAGILSNLPSAYLASGDDRCASCHIPHATISCFVEGCGHDWYHFSCALEEGYVFSSHEKKVTLCPSHAFLLKSDRKDFCSNVSFRRLVISGTHDHTFPVMDANAVMRSGSLIVHNIGVAEKMSSSIENGPSMPPFDLADPDDGLTFDADEDEKTKEPSSSVSHVFQDEDLLLSEKKRRRPRTLGVIFAHFKASRYFFHPSMKNELVEYNCQTQMQDQAPSLSSSSSYPSFSHGVSSKPTFKIDFRGNDNATAISITSKTPELAFRQLANLVRRGQKAKYGSLVTLVELPARRLPASVLFGISHDLLRKHEQLVLHRQMSSIKLNSLVCRRSLPHASHHHSRTRCVPSSELDEDGALPLTSSSSSLTSPTMAATCVVEIPLAMRYRRLAETSLVRVRVSPSSIQGLGVFASTELPAHDMVIEYKGEIVREEVSNLREAFYNSKGMGCYMFSIMGTRLVIDGTMAGNAARYINHSCSPNCVAKLMHFDGKPKIIIFSLRDIRKNEELTYDYKFQYDENDRVPCRCQAASCRGWMN